MCHYSNDYEFLSDPNEPITLIKLKTEKKTVEIYRSLHQSFYDISLKL